MKNKPNFLVSLHFSLLLFSLLLFLLAKSSPLLSTFGFESANFFAVLIGPAILWAASLNTADNGIGFSHILKRETFWFTLNYGLICLMLFLNGLFLTSCSTGAGFWPFLTISFPPLLLNLSLGCLLATLLNSRILKTLIVLIGYSLYYAWIIFCWWQHGTFRVLSHASILMSSDLMQGDSLSIGVIGFRVASLLLALALILCGIYFLNASKKKVFSGAKKHPTAVFLALGLIFLHFGLTYLSLKAIGKDRDDLLSDYSMLVEKNGIKVYANPLKTSRFDADLIATEAWYYKEKLIKRHLDSVEPITIWLHASLEDKYLYTGAKNVHFALPRHKEIHISGHEVPHEVLGHELAHIFLGSYSNSWLGYPSANGLVPNLAITEGLASALSRELNIQNGLTLLEQAQALYQAQVKVDLAHVFSANPLYFSLENPRVSYIYSGAFVEFLLSPPHETKQRIKSLAQQGSLDAISPEQKPIFEAFYNKLKEPVALYAIAWAHDNFKTTSIIISDCSNKGMNEKRDLKRALLNNRAQEALAIIELLPKQKQLGFLIDAIDHLIQSKSYTYALMLIDKALILARGDQFAESSLKLKQLQCLSSNHNYIAAQALLKEINLELYSPGTKRYLIAMDVFFSSFGNEEESLSRAAIKYFMSDGNPNELIYLTYELGRAQNTTAANLSRYLLARFELNEKEYSRALTSIKIVLDSKLLPTEIDNEARLMQIRAFLGLKDEQKALEAFNQLDRTKYRSADISQLSEEIDRLIFIRTHS